MAINCKKSDNDSWNLNLKSKKLKIIKLKIM